MKICGIEIHDTFGIFHLKVGNFTVLHLRGQNGSGKSSVIKSLAYVFGGGTDPGVIRKIRCQADGHQGSDGWQDSLLCSACSGAGLLQTEKSAIILTLDDSTVIEKVTRPKRARKGGEIVGYTTDLTVTQPDGTPRPAPQSFINELAESMAVDPSRILRIDASTIPGRRELADMLVKLLPVAFEPEEVRDVLSYRSNADVPHKHPDALAGNWDGGSLNLDTLAKVAVNITEQRRRQGTIRDDTNGAINRLEKALPETTGEYDGKAELLQLQKDLSEVEQGVANRRVEIEQQKAAGVGALDQRQFELCQATDRAFAVELARITEARDRGKAEAKAAHDAAVQELDAAAQQELADLQVQAQPYRDRINGDLGQVRERINAHQRAVTLRQEIDVQLQTHRAASWYYDQLSDVLKRIESMRLAKLKELPVPGLLVEDGMPTIDGVPWEHTNLARRVEVALQICCQRTGRLPLLLWDDSEHASTDTRDMIQQGLRDAGYQLICATVSDEQGLSVEILQ